MRSEHDNDCLVLTYNLSMGLEGKDESSDNPLSRATKGVFHSGKPSWRICQCFFRGSDEMLRWFGVFVHSQGERILFFPGYKAINDHVHVFGNSHSKEWNQPFVIDHLTLEPDRKTWHLTSPGSGHIGKLKARALEGCTHWFSASIDSAEVLRLVRRETLVSAEVSGSDTDRRAKILESMTKQAVTQILQLNREYELIASSSFLHFSVLVGPAGFTSPQNQIMGLPYGGKLASQRPDNSDDKAPIRIHRFQLSKDIEIEIVASHHPGKLSMPVVFGC